MSAERIEVGPRVRRVDGRDGDALENWRRARKRPPVTGMSSGCGTSSHLTRRSQRSDTGTWKTLHEVQKTGRGFAPSIDLWVHRDHKRRRLTLLHRQLGVRRVRRPQIAQDLDPPGLAFPIKAPQPDPERTMCKQWVGSHPETATTKAVRCSTGSPRAPGRASCSETRGDGVSEQA
jgi:hypothetical protein